jgi:hypothetical protein
VEEVQDQDDAECGRNHNTAKLRAGWFNIFSPELAMNGMPPADDAVFIFAECKALICEHMNTMGDVKTLQMGIRNTEFPEWVCGSSTLA